LDALAEFYAPDAVWDSGSVDIPGERFEGRAAIRGLFEDWFGMLETAQIHIDEIRDVGNGVVLLHFVQRAKPRGSSAWLDSRMALVSTWADGLIKETLVYTDIDEARAAAERLAKERG
jgi:ketosteroid isomerase-like protein